MQESIIDKIVDLENLYWAWRKLKHAYNRATDIWLNPIEICAFEAELDKNIKSIRDEVLKDQFELTPLYPVPYPKSKNAEGKAQIRPAFYVHTRDQLIWIATLGVVGPVYDYQMPFWSYGHRLFITSWVEKDTNDSKIGKHIHGWYRNSTSKIYRNWRQSWPRFRRHIQLTIRAMSGGLGNDRDNGILTVEEINELESNKDEKPFLRNSYLVEGYWNRNSPDLYWCSIDFKKFYPSINTSQLLKNLINYHTDLEHGSKEESFLKKLLDFKIHPDCKWSEEELEIAGLKDRVIGLPTGLIVSGFLSNIAMLGIDIEMSQKLKAKKIACFRFVDDHIILSNSIDDLVNWVEAYGEVIDKLNNGVKINHDKTEPEELRAYMYSTPHSLDKNNDLLS